jgi:B-cell receptor-associated protein 31
MSLQWTIIATFLYFEVGVLMLFLVPYMSAKRWNRLFRSRFYQALSAQAQWYFTFLLCILVLFLLDSIREMRKYSNPELNDAHQHLDHEMQANMRLFRAQRNFYISGIALFLSFVIKRFISLMTTQASLVAQSEASLKQAESASKAAKSYMSKKDGGDGESAELVVIKEELETIKADRDAIKKDRDAIKSQAESVSKEYDRLMAEHEKLQKTVGSESKKDD